MFLTVLSDSACTLFVGQQLFPLVPCEVQFVRALPFAKCQDRALQFDYMQSPSNRGYLLSSLQLNPLHDIITICSNIIIRLPMHEGPSEIRTKCRKKLSIKDTAQGPTNYFLSSFNTLRTSEKRTTSVYREKK